MSVLKSNEVLVVLSTARFLVVPVQADQARAVCNTLGAGMGSLRRKGGDAREGQCEEVRQRRRFIRNHRSSSRDLRVRCTWFASQLK